MGLLKIVIFFEIISFKLINISSVSFFLREKPLMVYWVYYTQNVFTLKSMLNMARDLFAQFHQLLTFYVEKKQKLNNKKTLIRICYWNSQFYLKLTICVCFFLFKIDDYCNCFQWKKDTTYTWQFMDNNWKKTECHLCSCSKRRKKNKRSRKKM